MSVFHENMLIGSSGQGAPAAAGISRSLRFNSSDSAYLSRTPASAGTSRTTWTVSFWAKRAALAATQWLFFSSDLSANTTGAYFTSSDTLEFYEFQSGSYASRLITTQVFRDPSAWYNLVFTWDTDNGTSTNRVRIYVNGVRIDTFSTSSYPSSGVQSRWNNNVEHYFGRGVGSEYFSGYLADIYFIDGQALDPSSFTETDATTGQLIPKAYTGTYGTNGFHLEFADNSSNTATTLGKDTSGNGNNFTPSNLSVTAGAGNDSLVDVPSSSGTDTGVGGEVRGNYCTLNPLKIGANATLTNGNLDFTSSTTTGYNTVLGTIGVSSGKWYWEVTATSSQANGFGIATDKVNINDYLGGDANGWMYYQNTGAKYNNNTAASYGSSYTTNDVIGFAFDADAGTITAYKNGVSLGVMYSGLAAGTYFPAVSDSGAQTCSSTANFGQRAFAYTAPSGFKALNTANLPAPVVTKPNTVMDVLLWTGNGSNTRSVSGLAFSPEFVWFKSRSAAYAHQLYDVVRGSGSGKNLISNQTDAEGAGSSSFGYLSSFDSSGFSLAAGSDSTFQWGNQSGTTYAAWTWDAGSSTDTNNTAGTITPTGVRANATAGFSIVTYTGNGTNNATVGHGLGVAPRFLIGMDRTGGNWQVWGANMNNGSFDCIMNLNTTDALATGITTRFRAASSTTFTIGTDGDINANGNTYVTYCFAPVVGYSSAFSISGNGSVDGPFCFLGFRPRFLIYKRTDVSGDRWLIWDAARNSYNQMTDGLFPNLSNAELNGYDIDFLSNGFKLRDTESAVNASGGTYIGFAFAESPFQYARAR